MEDTGSFAQLTRFVPTADEEMGSWIEDALAEAHEKSYADDLVTSRGSGQGKSEDGPDQLAAWNPDRRANLCQYELRRKLANDIARSPGHVDEVDLVCVHCQVLLHTPIGK